MARRSGARFGHCLASTVAAVQDTCNRIRMFLESHDLAHACFPVELAAWESLCNAVEHGNRRDAGKQVHVELAIGQRWIRLQVTDQGVGFDWRQSRTAPPPGSLPRGRGLAVCKLYASRLAFNQSGTQITLWFSKRKGGRPCPTIK